MQCVCVHWKICDFSWTSTWLTDAKSNACLRKQRAFNPGMFDMKAVGETLPSGTLASYLHGCLFNYSLRCMWVCVCVYMSGALGPVRLREMMSALRHMKQVQRRHCTAGDHTRRHNQTLTHTHKGKHIHIHACVTDRQLCVRKHGGVYHFDGVMQGMRRQ